MYVCVCQQVQLIFCTYDQRQRCFVECTQCTKFNRLKETHILQLISSSQTKIFLMTTARLSRRPPLCVRLRINYGGLRERKSSNNANVSIICLSGYCGSVMELILIKMLFTSQAECVCGLARLWCIDWPLLITRTRFPSHAHTHTSSAYFLSQRFLTK